MFITRIELENIKSYRQIVIDLRRGTTAISGANGAGKTTIVEAIGYALFDSLLYNQAQFVREGEKFGRIVVHLIGSDDRPYVVERRCGAGAYWTLNDVEADSRLEQRADVSDKLHEIFGIDRERSLKALFQDALGVQQGTFTAIFLQPGSARKQTFDTLLQVEDYRVAYENLREVQNYYKEQSQEQQNKIQALEFETRDLETWRDELRDGLALSQRQTANIAAWTEQRERALERQQELIAQKEALGRLESRYDQNKSAHQAAQQRLHDRHEQVQQAHAAAEIVEQSRPDYEQYLQADAALAFLRQDERVRGNLRQQQASSNNDLTRIQGTIANLHTRLEDIAGARQRIVELTPLVEQQHELDQQRDELTRQNERYQAILKEGKQASQQLASAQQTQQELQQRIALIEPLVPLAALLTERITLAAALKAQISERASKQKQWQEKQGQLQAKLKDRDTTAGRLRKLEDDITAIEEHRAEVETLPALQSQLDLVREQRTRLDSNIDGYRKSRRQSAGGLCPFLQEPCLNIQRRGMSNLNSYFDAKIAEEKTQLDTVLVELDAISARVTAVSKLAAALEMVGQKIEQRDQQAEHLQRLAVEIAGLERDLAELEHDLLELKDIQQRIAEAEQARDESRRADEQVRTLGSLRTQLQQQEETARLLTARVEELRQQEKELRGCSDQLKAVIQQLTDLNDPRGQTKILLDSVKQEPAIQARLRDEQQKHETAERELRALEKQLAAYDHLDQQIGQQEAVRQQTRDGYQRFLSNEQIAASLPQREEAHRQALDAASQAEAALAHAEQAYQEAQAAFDEDELTTVNNMVERLHGDLKEVSEALRNTQVRISDLERRIEQAEALVTELEAASKEKATLEDLHVLLGQFRNIIKEAGPQVLRAMLADISAEANRIFGEIMGDRSGQLAWQGDYEITLRRQGVNRMFAQLSGGEQMSAALAMRLALLKKLSSLNIAFFDEPTQNMDELRRMNLAEQIRRVRGFDQLIVISHDDTFEQGLDSIVRLKKMDGVTRIITDEEAASAERERAQVYAS